MSKGPEANFWQSIRTNLPKKCFATRIENKHGGGVPDVHMVWDGLPFWMELKVAKSNKVNISPHQVAWNMAYYARGGASFFLVKRAKERDLILFRGDQGAALSSCGLSCALGSRFEGLGPSPLVFYYLSLSLNHSRCFLFKRRQIFSAFCLVIRSAITSPPFSSQIAQCP